MKDPTNIQSENERGMNGGTKFWNNVSLLGPPHISELSAGHGMSQSGVFCTVAPLRITLSQSIVRRSMSPIGYYPKTII
jgi:hypothetical protein